jgi:hypothetical protein
VQLPDCTPGLQQLVVSMTGLCTPLYGIILQAGKVAPSLALPHFVLV